MDIFLDALAESSNVAASARAADIAANAMYRDRRRIPGFAARWHEALCEGSARLEAALSYEALIAPTGTAQDAQLKSRPTKYSPRISLQARHTAAQRGVPLLAAAPMTT